MSLDVIGAGFGRTGTTSLKLALGRLLVYDVAEGWKPLCGFLGVPVPGTPFPHANTSADFRRG